MKNTDTRIADLTEKREALSAELTALEASLEENRQACARQQSALDALHAAPAREEQSSIAQQLKAAASREADLRQQLKDAQSRLAKLGFLQLGKKMVVKAEADSISKKLAANLQLQEQLRSRQQPEAAPAPADPFRVMDAQVKLDELHAAGRAQEERLQQLQKELQSLDTVLSEAVAAAVQPAAQEKAAKPSRTRSVPKKPRAPRLPRAEMTTEEATARFLARLEKLYPEHQVFALDSISSELRDKLTVLTARTGSTSPAAFLEAQGWQLITSQQARTLRKGMYCTPGEEPEVIRPLLTSVMTRLAAHYPDRVISRSIQHDHKSLSQDVSGLYLWLGYASAADMLTAYGYSYQVSAGGRPTTDIQGVLDKLSAAYAGKPKARTIAQLMNEHPELAKSLKTLQNQSPALFGKPLRQHLIDLGVLAGKE
ncbi:MAG: hypothetical protein IJA77_01380 [Clostridia bacterium]|nr:hypothetical protein [Clostridia bacterium]